MVEILLQHKPWLTRYRHYETLNKPLHHAVYYNEAKIVRMLLDADATDVDTVNYKGFSPFHMAALNGSKEIFVMLLEYSNHRVLNYEGRNVLHMAVANNHESIVELIANDCHLSEMVHQQDVDGNTPMHIAAYEGFDKIIIIILGRVVTVQPQNLRGETHGDILRRRKEYEREEQKQEMQSRLLKATEDFQSGLLIMASLIITVTFTAGFTLPGGYNSSDPGQGTATLARKAGFEIFLISNSVAMGSAIIAAAALILFSVIYRAQKRFTTLKVGMYAIGISIIFMLIAFVAGVWAVTGSQRRWLAIMVAAVVLCIPLCLALLLANILVGPGSNDDDEEKQKVKQQQILYPKLLVSAI